jgi:hypothetical protein
MGVEQAKEVSMATKKTFTRQVVQTALLTVGLTAALVFGIILLITGDWLPATIIVAAALIGLVRTIPVIHGLCSGAFSPPHKPAH